MKKVAIGVDIGGSSVKLGVVDLQGRLTSRDSFLTCSTRGRRQLLDVLTGRLFELMRRAKRAHLAVSGVGIGAPGPVDVERGFVYFFPNIPGWRNTPLAALLERRLGVRVKVDNDANVMTLAEHRFGAGRGSKNMIALTLGTGIGGGLVIDGRLFHGPRFSAAEIGHIVINENGPLCSCGGRGCVETYVGSGYFTREVKARLRSARGGVLKRWVERGRKELTPCLVAEAARHGDALSKKMWQETGAHLGTALAGLVNVLNPERIVLGGGIAQSGALIFGPVKQTLEKKAFPIAARSVRVVAAKRGVDAGVVGAAALVLGEPEE